MKTIDPVMQSELEAARWKRDILLQERIEACAEERTEEWTQPILERERDFSVIDTHEIRGVTHNPMIGNLKAGYHRGPKCSCGVHRCSCVEDGKAGYVFQFFFVVGDESYGLQMTSE